MKSICLVFTCFCFFLFSCKKEELIENETDNTILHFESYYELQNELSSIKKMTLSEKVEWAKSKGFSSQGVSMDLFYQSFDPEVFDNRESLIEYINKSYYLDLVEDENGEYSVQPKDWDNKYRYFVNKDNIFTVGDQAIKIFNEKIIITCIDNIDKLKTIKNSSDQLVDNNIIMLINNEKSIVVNSTYPGCGINLYSAPESINDKRKYRVELKIWVEDNYNYFTNENSVETHYQLKSQRTTLGIFFNYNNNITYSLMLRSRFINGLGIYNWHYFNLSGSQSASVIEDYKYDATANFNYNAQVFFLEFDCEAYVPETINAKSKLYCN